MDRDQIVYKKTSFIRQFFYLSFYLSKSKNERGKSVKKQVFILFFLILHIFASELKKTVVLNISLI